MSSQFKVLHLLSNRWNSAITEYALSVARSLELTGHSCIFSPLRSSPAFKRAKTYGLSTYPFEEFSSLKAVRRFKTIERDFEPDIIMVYGGKETSLSKLKSKKTRCFRFRGNHVKNNNVISRLSSLFSLSHCDGLITPCQLIKSQYNSQGLKKPIFIVPLGIDTDKFLRRDVEKPKRPELLIFGRLDPIKGHKRFMSFFAELIKSWKEDMPPPFLKIIGQEENLSGKDLFLHAEQIGLKKQDFDIICQRIKEPSLALSKATLGVIPSLGSELICRVSEEFLCSGTAILTSQAGALSEIKLDGSSLHVEDFWSHKNKIIELIKTCFLETEETRRHRSQAAKKLFGMKKMAEEMTRVFQTQN